MVIIARTMPSDARREGLSGSPAAGPCLPGSVVAGLVPFRGIYAEDADPPPADNKRVAIDHPRRACHTSRRGHLLLPSQHEHCRHEDKQGELSRFAHFGLPSNGGCGSTPRRARRPSAVARCTKVSRAAETARPRARLSCHA